MVCKSQHVIRLHSAVWPSWHQSAPPVHPHLQVRIPAPCGGPSSSHMTQHNLQNLSLNWADRGSGGALTIESLGSRSAIHPILSKLRHRRSESFLITTFHIIAFSFICTLRRRPRSHCGTEYQRAGGGLNWIPQVSQSPFFFFYFNLFNLGLLLWFVKKKKILPHLFLQGSGLITWQHIPVINPWSCTAALWQEALLVWLQDFLLQRQRAAK